MYIHLKDKQHSNFNERNMKLRHLFITLAFLGLGISLSAQTATPGLTQRQVNQSLRIKHGIVNGELTRIEARKLKGQQRHIQRSKARAKADGVVTPYERTHIRSKQSRASRNIRRQKQDRQDRF